MKKNKKLIPILTISLFLLIGAVGTTLCLLISSDAVTNKFQTGDNKIDIVEDFQEPENWNGDEYKKVVKISNTTNDSKSPVLVRVSIIPRWEDEKGLPSTNLSVDVVKLKFSEGEKWLKGDDGYYYYKSLLQPQESTSEILKSVSLEIPENEKSKYKGKTLKIDVNAESVQANKTAYRLNWNIEENSKIDELLNSLVK